MGTSVLGQELFENGEMVPEIKPDKVGIPPKAFVEVVTFDGPTKVRDIPCGLAFFDALIECGRLSGKRGCGHRGIGGKAVHVQRLRTPASGRKRQVLLLCGENGAKCRIIYNFNWTPIEAVARHPGQSQQPISVPMKHRNRLSLAVLILVVVSAAFEASADCLKAPEGLRAWFRLEDNTKDLISPLVGSLPEGSQFGPGKVGNGISLEGRVGVVLPQSPRLNGEEFTVEMWIRRSDTTRASTSPSGDGALFAGAYGSYSLTLSGDGRVYMSHVGIESFNFGATIKDLDWHHLVMVRKAARFTLYVDGQPGGEVVREGVVTVSPLSIGSLATPFGGESFGFLGSIDEVGYYGRELSAQEILSLAGSGAEGKCLDVQVEGDCEPAPAGNVAWFPLDHDARNLVPGGPAGGESTVTFGPGIVDGAAFFDGNAMGIPVADDARLRSQDFAVEAWIRRASETASSQASPADGAVFSGGERSYAMAIQADGTLYLSHVGQAYHPSDVRITDTNWHHIAMSKSGALLSFYLDGNPGGVRDLGGTVFDLSSPFAVGSLGVPYFGIPYAFWGSIDELGYYDRPLSSSEIQAIWLAGGGGKCRGGLRLRVSAPSEVKEGESFEFVTSVGNQGTNALSGVVVTNRIPAGFTVGKVEATAGTATTETGADGARVILQAVELPIGSQATVRVVLENSPQGHYSIEATANLIGDTSSVAASAQVFIRPPCVPAPGGLAAWWRGDGDARDEIAGAVGAASNGVSYVEGRVGNAFRFDGLSGSGVNLGRVPALQRSEFTIEGWLRRASTGVVSQSGDAGNILGADFGGWTFVLLRDGSLTFGRSDISSVTTSPVLLDVAWHHVAVARTASEVRFYVDGQRVATRAYVETFNLDLDYSLGTIFPSGRNAFLGELDEIAFYNRILEDAEIAAIPQAGGAPKCVNDLVVSAGAGGPIPVGENWEIPITVTTKGAVDSTQVGLTNAIPPGLQLVSATSSQGTIDNLAGLLRANLGTIPAGSNAVVTIVVRPLLEGVYDIPVNAGRREAELTESNNRATIRGTAVRLAVSLEGDVTTTEPTEAEFAVVLNAPMIRTVTVNYATEAGTATAGADFESRSGVLEFPPGVVRQTVKVPVVGDGLYELDESFTLVLSQPVNAELGVARALGNIVSPDPLPVVRVRSVTAPEGNAGPSSFGFEFELDRASGLPARLRFATTNDSAKAPTDFVATEGTLEFPPGQTLATVTVTVNGDTAVEPNEMFLLSLSEPQGLRFPATPPAPAVGTIVNEDAVAGLVTSFRWKGLPPAVDVGTPFPAQIEAMDGFLNPVPGFNGVVGLQAYAGPGLPSQVILTEIAINTGRGVELQNVSAEDVDVGGWKVYFYDLTLWPAPKYTFTIPQGTTVRPAEVFTVEVNPNLTSPGIYPRFRQTGTLRWNERGVPGDPRSILVGVVVTDVNGAVEDSFFGGSADPRSVGIPTVLSAEDWEGNAVVNQSTGIGFYRPSGQKRNERRASDWRVSSLTTASMNRANTGLVLPYVDSLPLAVSPDSASGFGAGLWSGNLTLNGYASQVRLVADDGNGHRSLSEPFAVRVADDLTVAMTVDSQVVTAPTWNSDFVVAVTNLGPVLSSNVTARVVLSATYGSAISSIIGQPVASQGTVTVRTRLSPITGPQAEITANFGDLPGGGVATLTIRAAKTVLATSRDLPLRLESSVALSREPVELNLDNNAATVVQELSASCAPLGVMAVAWWAGESGYTDLLGVHAGVVDGVVGFGEPRVGSASFEFDGAQGAIRVPDSPALNFGADESLSLEFWMWLPVDAANSLAVLGKEETVGSGRSGYAVTLEQGVLQFRMGDGTRSRAWSFGGQPLVDLRDEAWHHMVVSVERQSQTTVRASIDGQSYFGNGVGETPGSLANGAPLRFGEAAPGSPEGRFKGRLDELVVYREARSFEQGQAAYRAGAHGHCVSEFVIEPVSPKYATNFYGWSHTDPGVAGQPYRFDFQLRNRGPLTSPVSFSVVPNSLETNLYLLTVDGSVGWNAELGAAKVDLSHPQSPGEVLPFAVYVTSTNPVVPLNLFGGGQGIRQLTATAGVLINLRADTDGDGIPDDVEVAAGLNPLSSADAGSDADGDGYTAAAEFEAGTAPNDANSALRLRIVEGQVVVDALASRVYRLEYRSDLSEGGWLTLREVRPESDGLLTVGPLGSGTDPLYYRVTVGQPYGGPPN